MLERRGEAWHDDDPRTLHVSGYSSSMLRPAVGVLDVEVEYPVWWQLFGPQEPNPDPNPNPNPNPNRNPKPNPNPNPNANANANPNRNPNRNPSPSPSPNLSRSRQACAT